MTNPVGGCFTSVSKTGRRSVITLASQNVFSCSYCRSLAFDIIDKGRTPRSRVKTVSNRSVRAVAVAPVSSAVLLCIASTIPRTNSSRGISIPVRAPYRDRNVSTISLASSNGREGISLRTRESISPGTPSEARSKARATLLTSWSERVESLDIPPAYSFGILSPATVFSLCQSR